MNALITYALIFPPRCKASKKDLGTEPRIGRTDRATQEWSVVTLVSGGHRKTQQKLFAT